MILYEIIGWISNLFFIFGVYLIAKKNINGFYCNILGNLLYAIQSTICSNYSLFFLSLGLIGLNIYSVFEWSKKEIKEEKFVDLRSRAVADLYDDYNINLFGDK